jgi:hypothetical protein
MERGWSRTEWDEIARSRKAKDGGRRTGKGKRMKDGMAWDKIF